MEDTKDKNRLLDEAISLYTQGHPQEAVLKLEALYKLFPDDIELRDTLNTIKAEVHDLNRDKAAEKPAVPIVTSDDIKQNARKRVRIALGILILLIVLITGLWGFAKVLSSYQNRGTGTYRLEEEKANEEKGVTSEPESSSTPQNQPTDKGKSITPGTTAGDKTGGTSSSETVPPTPTSPMLPTPGLVTLPVPSPTPVTPTPTPIPETYTPHSPSNGYLSISPAPPTLVYVDGVMLGNSQRLGTIKLLEGNHKITLVSQQYGSRSLSVKIRPNATTEISFPY